ncbi:Uncharacterised protein [uncultured archaeon]|nr:Uncharacterised protein [uncultured archaeon]
MKVLLALALIVIIILIIYVSKQIISPLLGQLPDNDITQEMKRRINKLLVHLMTNIDQYNKKEREVIEKIWRNYNDNNMRENLDPDPPHDTTYIIGKGSTIAVCLKQIHNIDTLTFVMIHELSHMGLADMEHPLEYWQIFKFLLIEATKMNLLNCINYSKYPVKYCGLLLDANPLFSDHVKPI